MSLRFDTRTQRRGAFAMLLVWLFVLGAGVAHACVVHARASHDRDAVLHAVAPDDRANGHDSGARQACLKACEDATRSLPKQPSSDVGLPVPGLLAITPWVVAVAGAATAVPDRVWPPVAALPVRLRFSRLTL